MKGTLFIISSPSGGGKGTLIRRLFDEVEGLRYSVSYTTRAMRDGETNGKEYHFVSVEEFEELIRGDEFLEYAMVHGNYYGTSQNQINRATEAGHDVVLEIDVQGAAIVRRKRRDAVNIFILPPSFPELAERLRKRGTETEEQLSVRLANARKEVEFYEKCDYVIINDKLDIASEELKAVILAKRVERDRQKDGIRDILTSFES